MKKPTVSQIDTVRRHGPIFGAIKDLALCSFSSFLFFSLYRSEKEILLHRGYRRSRRPVSWKDYCIVQRGRTSISIPVLTRIIFDFPFYRLARLVRVIVEESLTLY
jgi:hypothetical protein